MQWIEVLIPESDAEMQVLPGYPARCPGNANDLSGSHGLTRHDQDIRKVPVNTLKFTMRNTDIVAQDGVKSGGAYPAVHNTENRIAAGGKVNTLVQVRVPGNGVNPLAER